MGKTQDTNRQRRQRQNRAQRAALEARTKAATAPRPSREAPAASGRTPKAAAATAEAGSTATPAPRRGLFGRSRPDGKERPARPPRPGDRPVDIDTLEGGWLKKRVQVPGGTQVLMAMALAVVVTPLMFATKFPEDGAPADAELTLSFIDKFGAWTAVFAAVPLLITGFAVQSILSPRRRTIWLWSSLVMGVLVAVFLGVYFNHIFVLGFLTYGIWRAGRVEGPSPRALAARQRAAEDAQQRAAAKAEKAEAKAAAKAARDAD